MVRTFTLKVKSQRMVDHLEAQFNTSGYIRDLVEADMLTNAEELRQQLEAMEDERAEMEARQAELDEREANLRERLEDAQELESEVSMDICSYLESLITIQPEDREKNITKLVTKRVPETSSKEVIDALEGVDLHHYDEYTGRATGEQFDEDFESAGFDPEEFGTLGIKIEESDTEAYEFVTSLTPRERKELESALPAYF